MSSSRSTTFYAVLFFVFFLFSGLFYYSSSLSSTASTPLEKQLSSVTHASPSSDVLGYSSSPIPDLTKLTVASENPALDDDSSTSPSKQSVHHYSPGLHQNDYGNSNDNKPTTPPRTLSDFKSLLSSFNLDSIFPLEAGATNEPFQPSSSSSADGGKNKLCPVSSITTPNDDVYEGCRLPGINNVLYTQHSRWCCIHQGKMKKKQQPYQFRDRFCNKGTAEKIRYSSLLQIRYDKILLHQEARTADEQQKSQQRKLCKWSSSPPPPPKKSSNNKKHDLLSSSCKFWNDNSENENDLKSKVTNAISRVAKRYRNENFAAGSSLMMKKNANDNNFACWTDVNAKQQLPIPDCGWLDVPNFYFTSKFWISRRLIDFHERYYIAGKVIATMLFGSSSPPDFISVHLRRGDYYQHCAKVKMGKRVKEWVTFSKSPASETSLFAPGTGSKKSQQSSQRFSSWLKLQPQKDPYQSNHNQSIPGCYPSLIDIEYAFDKISEVTGIKNIFIATNTPDDLSQFGIVDDLVDRVSSTKRKNTRNRKWRAALLPKDISSLFFKDRRKVDDVILEMVMLSLGKFFILNRFSSFSANALEMAIIHDRVSEKPSEWDNVVTW